MKGDRLKALINLRYAVRAGRDWTSISGSIVCLALGLDHVALAAIILSPHQDMRALGAAKALHDAVLPGDYIMSSDTTGFAIVWRDEYECTQKWSALVPGNQARAELLAILEALIAQEQNGTEAQEDSK